MTPIGAGQPRGPLTAGAEAARQRATSTSDGHPRPPCDDGNVRTPGVTSARNSARHSSDQCSTPATLQDRRSPDGMDRDVIVCCSGGGIRSAAYCLGGLQSLSANAALWSRVATITAVSGGAYIASALAVTDHYLTSSRRKAAAREPLETAGPDSAPQDANKGSPLEDRARGATRSASAPRHVGRALGKRARARANAQAQAPGKGQAASREERAYALGTAE